MTAQIAKRAADDRAWLAMRCSSLRAEYAADDVLARRRGPHARVPRKPRSRSFVAPLVDATLAGALALFLVFAFTLVLTTF